MELDLDKEFGCVCQRCFIRYKVDFNLDSKLWEQVHGNYKMLCGSCIAQWVELQYKFKAFKLIELKQNKKKN